jgi:hypothetical protein
MSDAMTGWMPSSAQVATMECAVLVHATMQRWKDCAMHIKPFSLLLQLCNYAMKAFILQHHSLLVQEMIPHTANNEQRIVQARLHMNLYVRQHLQATLLLCGMPPLGSACVCCKCLLATR